MCQKETTGHNQLCENHIIPCPLIKIWWGSEVSTERQRMRERERDLGYLCEMKSKEIKNNKYTLYTFVLYVNITLLLGFFWFNNSGLFRFIP